METLKVAVTISDEDIRKALGEFYDSFTDGMKVDVVTKAAETIRKSANHALLKSAVSVAKAYQDTEAQEKLTKRLGMLK